ncbi:hypothetical protein UA08_09412 [Talaromyces atroroseus]|uniref:Aminotransferase n=1 Tax=Talaromyces atroroseus TaxID=1441469 RepID=A0A1Q5Q6E0_TALAT|nr:hypothetical protein UA08_09412 [Talaromyces atroroseus]OKL55310.1 hypothetical protein UA08_09412 [Talaromyces atroroseus]
MENLSQIDIKSHLHPFTPISEDRTPGRIVDHAEGIRIRDQHGRTYVDAISGLWCVNVGYGNRQIADAIQQASRTVSFAPTMFGASNEYATRLADRLLRLCSGASGMRKVFFGHSGSDANETALKLARLYFLASGQPMRTKFISCWDSYHGTTLATASLSGLPGHHRNFALPDPSFLHVSAPDVFDALTRRGFSSEDDYVDFLVKEMEDTIIAAGGGDKVAAFFVEPLMAVGGILPPPSNYFPRIKEVLDRHDILLVIDDVVCAFGRLGHWFGWETTGVQPDMVSLAKGLTSGCVPMSATLVGERVWSVLEQHQDQIGVFGHGFTMSGHPVAAAAALANIEVIERENLLSKGKDTGNVLLYTVRNATRYIPTVVNVRGRGLLVGIELAGVQASEVAQKCLDLGLIVRAIVGRNTIALAPPLITSEDDILKIVGTIRKVLVESNI